MKVDEQGSSIEYSSVYDSSEDEHKYAKQTPIDTISVQNYLESKNSINSAIKEPTSQE